MQDIKVYYKCFLKAS